MRRIKYLLIAFLTIFSFVLETAPSMAQRGVRGYHSGGHGYHGHRYKGYGYKGYHGYHGHGYKAPWYVALPYISSLTPLVSTIWHHPYFYSWAYPRYPVYGYGPSYYPGPVYINPYVQPQPQSQQQIIILPQTQDQPAQPKAKPQTQPLYPPSYETPSRDLDSIGDNPIAGYNANGTPVYNSGIPLKQTDPWGVKW